jgi:hypothetical protein
MSFFKKSGIFAAVLFTLLLAHQNNSFATQGENHQGLYLRFLLGGGYLSATEKDFFGSDLKIHGNAGHFSFQIGGAVTNNFILFFDYAAVAAKNPKAEWSGVSVSTSGTELQLQNAGGGITYYFMPINMYLSVSVVAAKATLKVNSDSGATELGPGVNIALGKEWWVSDNWGLGIALVGHYSKVKSDEGVLGKKDVVNSYIGVAFSATYN